MTWAILPAAGRGARFGSSMPKQYLEVAGLTLVEHSLRALLGHPGVDGVMVALAPPTVKYIPLDVATQRMKNVPLDCDTMLTARDLGISFGD